MSVHARPDERVAQIASLQRGRAARRQLIAAGLTDAIVHRMLTQGRLIPRHPGVYAVGHEAPVEIAGEATEDEVEGALDDALNRNLTRRSQTRDLLRRAGQGRRGAKLLTRLLGRFATSPTLSSPACRRRSRSPGCVGRPRKRRV